MKPPIANYPFTQVRPIDRWIHRKLGPHYVWYPGARLRLLIAKGNVWKDLLKRTGGSP